MTFFKRAYHDSILTGKQWVIDTLRSGQWLVIGLEFGWLGLQGLVEGWLVERRSLNDCCDMAAYV